ncbi:MAG: hypothetical protein ACMVO3_24810 [Thalassobaculum sp.]
MTEARRIPFIVRFLIRQAQGPRYSGKGSKLISNRLFCLPASGTGIRSIRWSCLQRSGTNFVSHTIRALDRLCQGQTFALDDFELGLIDGSLDGFGLDCSVSHRVLSPFCAPELEQLVAGQSRRFGALFNYHEAPLMHERAFSARFPKRTNQISTPSKNPNLFVFQIRNPYDQIVSAARALQNYRRNPGMTRPESLIDFAWRMHKAWVIQVVESIEFLDFPFVFVNYDLLVANPEQGFPCILEMAVKSDTAELLRQHVSEALTLTSPDRVREFELTHGRALANDQRANSKGRIKSHVGNVGSGMGRQQVPDDISRDIELFYSEPRYSRIFEDPAVEIF